MGEMGLDHKDLNTQQESRLSLLLEYLDEDPAPVFVVDYTEGESSDLSRPTVKLEYLNRSLRLASETLEPTVRYLFSSSEHEEHLDFIHNISIAFGAQHGVVRSSSSVPMRLCSLTWNATMVGRRWVVLRLPDYPCPRTSGTQAIPLRRRTQVNGGDSRKFTQPSAAVETVDSSVSRNTRLLGQMLGGIDYGHQAHNDWLNSFDWTSSVCGPVAQWSSELRQVVDMVIACPDPVCVLWGEDEILIYNEPYSVLPGEKHPGALGRPFRENWGEFYSFFQPLHREIRQTGKAVVLEDQLRLVQRDGYLQALHFSFTLLPVFASDGAVHGIYIHVSEHTKQLSLQRRTAALLAAHQSMASATSLDELWHPLVGILDTLARDISFAVVYRVSQVDRATEGRELMFVPVAQTGNQHDSDAWSGIASSNIDDKLAAILATTEQKGEPVLLASDDPILGGCLMHHFRQYGLRHPCREIVVQPITANGAKGAIALLVVGINPLTVFNDDYRLFMRLLTRYIESSVTTVRTMVERLSEALESKRQQENFLDMTSHEMRNPLGAILSAASELVEQITVQSHHGARSEVSTEVLSGWKDLASIITYCANHQKRIIDDILTVSKLDSKLLRVFPIETRPLEMVRKVLTIFEPELRSAAITLDIEVLASYRQRHISSVFLDTHRVSQILINLLTNAIKFMKPQPHRRLRVILEASTTEPMLDSCPISFIPCGNSYYDPFQGDEWQKDDIFFLSFYVQDTGPGLTEEEASHLFTRFSQGSSRTHAIYGGSGLGLFISRELAEMHGGRIGFVSQSGSGSTFGFYVKTCLSVADHHQTLADLSPQQRSAEPQSKVTNQAHTDTFQTPSLTSQVRGVVKLTTLPPLSILIIEDNLINQRLLEKLLVKHGHTIKIASNGEEGISIVQTSTWNTDRDRNGISEIDSSLHFDIVLCDIEMPVMDGKTWITNIRRMQADGLLHPKIPAIAVTGNARPQQVREILAYGFDDLVTKPYHIRELLEVVEKCFMSFQV